MDPITFLGLGAAAVAALRFLGKKKDEQQAGASKPAGELTPSGFDPFGPSEQGAAWYAATGLQWVPTSALGDNAGHQAKVYRGGKLGDPNANRLKNDSSFRDAMAGGLRVVVSTSVLAGASDVPPYLLLVPDGFSRSSVPSNWGELRQLFAPPPGTFGAPPAGPFPGPGPVPFIPGPAPILGGDPFAEIPDASTRAKIAELYRAESVSLLDLDQTAAELDKAGYPNAATALRERRKQLALQRAIEAKQTGGWLYVVRSGDIPIKVAQHYGGVRPASLKELGQANPKIAANNWRGWVVGEEVLLPGAWADPSTKPAPPLAGVAGLPQPKVPPPPSIPAPSGPIAAAPGIYPGKYIDPATGKPVKAPGSLPWTDPGNPWGAAGPPGTPLPGGGLQPGTAVAAQIPPSVAALLGGG